MVIFSITVDLRIPFWRPKRIKYHVRFPITYSDKKYSNLRSEIQTKCLFKWLHSIAVIRCLFIRVLISRVKNYE